MTILGMLAAQNIAKSLGFGLTDEEKKAKKDKAELEEQQKLAQTKSTEGYDPHAFHTISYPSDIGSMENGHWMLFYVNRQNHSKYDSSSGRGTIYERVNAKTASTDAGGKTAWEFARDRLHSHLQSRIQQGGNGTVDMSDAVTLMPSYNSKATWGVMNPTTTRITDSVAIYLPSNIKSDMSASYEAADMGIVGMMAAAGASVKDVESFISNLGGALWSTAKHGFARTIGAAADIIGGSERSADMVLKNMFGAATNPYMEVLFDQMAERNFTYNFTFQPRNAQETLDVHKIIKLFRFHMAPEMRGQNDKWLTLPSTFDIHYMYQHGVSGAVENTYYNRIATCVLSSCVVDYAPEGVRSFGDGAPTAIKMDLAFKEMELLTKEMIDVGY